MKTVFDNATRSGLITRIESLTKNSEAQWGKMNLYQMLKHCTLWEEMVLRNKTYKRVFIGKLLGKMILKNVLKDDRPLTRNSPTIPALVVHAANGDVDAQKREWISVLGEYANLPEVPSAFVHPFFGPMTRAQIGIMAFKHADHHLRQFNA